MTHESGHRGVSRAAALVAAGIASLSMHAVVLGWLGLPAEGAPAPNPARGQQRVAVWVANAIREPVALAHPAPNAAPAPQLASRLRTESLPGPADAGESTAMAHGTIDPEQDEDGRFMPAEQLDWPALPRSAPDFSLLRGATASGLPIRLRLFIDAGGNVVDVRVLRASPMDQELAQRMRVMFRATGFLPGKHGGADVASRKDIELQVSDLS